MTTRDKCIYALASASIGAGFALLFLTPLRVVSILLILAGLCGILAYEITLWYYEEHHGHPYLLLGGSAVLALGMVFGLVYLRPDSLSFSIIGLGIAVVGFLLIVVYLFWLPFQSRRSQSEPMEATSETTQFHDDANHDEQKG